MLDLKLEIERTYLSLNNRHSGRLKVFIYKMAPYLVWNTRLTKVDLGSASNVNFFTNICTNARSENRKIEKSQSLSLQPLEVANTG